MGEALTIRVRREQGYAIVAVAGEVDIATVTRLLEPLITDTDTVPTLADPSGMVTVNDLGRLAPGLRAPSTAGS